MNSPYLSPGISRITTLVVSFQRRFNLLRTYGKKQDPSLIYRHLQVYLSLNYVFYQNLGLGEIDSKEEKIIHPGFSRWIPRPTSLVHHLLSQVLLRVIHLIIHKSTKRKDLVLVELLLWLVGLFLWQPVQLSLLWPVFNKREEG